MLATGQPSNSRGAPARPSTAYRGPTYPAPLDSPTTGFMAQPHHSHQRKPAANAEPCRPPTWDLIDELTSLTLLSKHKHYEDGHGRASPRLPNRTSALTVSGPASGRMPRPLAGSGAAGAGGQRRRPGGGVGRVGRRG